MKSYTNSLKKFTAMFLVLFFAIFASATPAMAQFPGTNGRIMWSGGDNLYTIKPDGSDINNTGLPNNGENTTWQGVYAPSGQFILFLDEGANGSSGIFATNNTHDITPEEISNIPGAGRSGRNPAISPDGTKYAFVVEDAPGDIEIRIKDVNSTSPYNPGIPAQFLTDGINGVFTAQPVWDPDGQTIYAKNGTRAIAINPITSLQTAATTIIPNGVHRLNDIDPTGTSLLYIKITGSGQKLFAYNMNTSTDTQITTDTAVYIGGYYSPDGTQIVATRIAAGDQNAQLVIMDADGTNQSVVDITSTGLDPGVMLYRPFWSTDQTTFDDSTLPTCTLTATPSSVASGEDTSIAWTSTNATSISLNQGIGELDPVEEGSVTGPVPASVTLTATVEGPGGTGTCSTSITVGGGSATPGLPNSGASSLVRQTSPVIYILLLTSTATLVFVGRRLYKKQFSRVK